MSVEENKALIRRLYDEVFAKWNLGVIDELVGSEFVGHEMPPGTPRGPVGVELGLLGLLQQLGAVPTPGRTPRSASTT